MPPFKPLLSVFLLAVTFGASAQNDTTGEGLRVGKWVVEYPSDKTQESGYYKIVPLSRYKIIREVGGRYFEIKYKGSTPLLAYDQKRDNRISVKDSLWQMTDSTGRLLVLEDWTAGLLLGRKIFDSNSNLIEHQFEDYENDTSFNLYYENNRLYKKAFYPPDNKNQQTVIYYPKSNLIIPDAEPWFRWNFTDIAVNVHALKLSCKKDLTILSVTSSSENIQVSFPFNSVPYKLAAKDTAVFNLIFTPTPASFRERDTITIVTSEENVPPYKVYCSSQAAHISGNNVETLQALSLSKTRDKYLVVAPLGTVTHVAITNSSGVDRHYTIQGITKIALDELDTGEYHISAFGCHIGGIITLNIKE